VTTTAKLKAKPKSGAGVSKKKTAKEKTAKSKQSILLS